MPNLATESSRINEPPVSSNLPFRLDEINLSALRALEKATTPKMTKYIPHIPRPKQAAFLLLSTLEGLFGGAAGGGKSDALLMAALQYVDVPGYAALLLRRSYSDLALPGALMDRAQEWLMPWVQTKEVHWSEKDKTYTFPCGATLTFGYLEAEKDKFRYQSAEFQFVGFDELTQFTETQYRYLFSRLRRLKDANVPIRMRSATNPDGDGIQWVHQRFLVEGPSKGRIFIPSKLEDNPHVDQESYDRALEELDPLTRIRLRHGVWALDSQVGLFSRAWFDVVDREKVPERMRKARYWDFAATDPKKKSKGEDGRPGKGPDWTVGVLLGEKRGIYYVLDVVRERLGPEGVEALVRATARKDGPSVPIGIEEEPGSSGKIVSDHYMRNVLKGYAVFPKHETGSKVLRAVPVSAAAKKGLVRVVRAEWNTAFLDEIEVVPYGRFDDQVDGLSGAFSMLRTVVPLGVVPMGVDDGRPSYWSTVG